MSRLALLALVLCACSPAGEPTITRVTPPAEAPADWLPPGHPAAAAQARWGLPMPCEGLAVRMHPWRELQPLCNSPEELAARAPGVRSSGCYLAGTCEVHLADDLTDARRELVLTHELGHLLKYLRGGDAHHITGPACDGKERAALMCAGGPSDGCPDPTAIDFDWMLGLEPAVAQ